jgi:hypothetical protein
MDDRSNRKRGLTEDDGSAPSQATTSSPPVNGSPAHYTPPPPPNKRLYSNSGSGSSSPRTPTKDDGEPMTAAEVTKDGISGRTIVASLQLWTMPKSAAERERPRLLDTDNRDKIFLCGY